MIEARAAGRLTQYYRVDRAVVVFTYTPYNVTLAVRRPIPKNEGDNGAKSLSICNGNVYIKLVYIKRTP